MRYRINFEDRLTLNQLKKVVMEIQSRRIRYDKLEKYYLGKNVKIQTESKTNPVVIPYGRKIINTITGYMYKPSFIGFSSDNKKYMERINEVFFLNHEDEITAELGKMCSTYGVAYELHFVDEEPKFVHVPPKEMLGIYGELLTSNEMVCAVRMYTVEEVSCIDVYYKDIIQHLTCDTSGMIRVRAEEEPHGYTTVPVAEYINNEEQMGDFEPVIGLIDAYDLLMSDSVGEIEKLAEAYLVLTNAAIDKDAAQEMKRRRILELMEGGKAEFLTKNVSPELLRFIRDWLREEIHSQSQIPNMTDSQFAGQQSGVAIRYKLSDLENLCSVKEIYFKKGLYSRLHILDDLMDRVSGDIGDVREVEITFTRNIPMNYLEIAQIVQLLRGQVSHKTILEKIVPFVTDVEAELKKLELETDPYAFNWGDDEPKPNDTNE